MKFLKSNYIECSPRVMSQTLACDPTNRYGNGVQFDLSLGQYMSGESSMFEICLYSGAKLLYDKTIKRFCIFGYASGQQDAIDAMYELRFLNALRMALHYGKKPSISRHGKRTLKISWQP